MLSLDPAVRPVLINKFPRVGIGPMLIICFHFDFVQAIIDIFAL